MYLVHRIDRIITLQRISTSIFQTFESDDVVVSNNIDFAREIKHTFNREREKKKNQEIKQLSETK